MIGRGRSDNPHTPDGSVVRPSRTLFVRNIAYGAAERDIAELFQVHHVRPRVSLLPHPSPPIIVAIRRCAQSVQSH